MNRDEIIRMAREADLWLTSDERIAAVERFHAIAVAAEREACALVCDALSDRYADEGGDAGSCAAAIRARGEA